MPVLRYPPEPYMPRILPLFWGAPDDQPKTYQNLRAEADACLDLARQLRPCFGPRGVPKRLAFRFLRGLGVPPVHTPDTFTVLAQMRLGDPAAYTLASAAVAQAQEVGDGAVLVLLLGASLLEQAHVCTQHTDTTM